MNKTKLQQELLAKIKPGVKASDLKKSKNSNGEKAFGLLSLPVDDPLISPSHQENNTPPSSPPASPIIEPIDQTRNNRNNPKETKPEKDQKIQQLQEQVDFWSQTAQTHLTNLQRTTAQLDQAQERIKELETQPNQLSQEIATALKEANQRIRDLEGKNKQLRENITQLENQSKTPEKTKPEETKPQTFLCSHCQQEWSPEFLRLINPQNQKTCADCLNNMLELTKKATGKEIVIEEQSKPQPQPLKPCQFCRQPKPTTSLKPRHIKNLPNKDPREITLICQDCLTYRAIKADYYCPLTSEGRDTYEGTEFDCYCPNERRTN